MDWTRENQASGNSFSCSELGGSLRGCRSSTADHAKTQEALIDFYTSSMREVDRLQREFEQAERDLLIKQDGVDVVIPHARTAYRKLVDKSGRVYPAS